MKQVPVSSLTGPLLCQFVAQAIGLEGFVVYDGRKPFNFHIYTESLEEMITKRHDLRQSKEYRPDLNDELCFGLIKKYEFGLHPYEGNKGIVWCVEYDHTERWIESNDLNLAVCRAVVTHVFGDMVEVK